MLVKHGLSGGKNVFELVYEKDVELNFSLQAILLQCVVYDSELEADYYELEEMKRSTKKERMIISPKQGMREHMYEIWMQENYPEYVDIDVTILTTEEFNRVGQSANYYRDNSAED